jgi:putative endonuclease
MPFFSRIVFGLVNRAARRGLAAPARAAGSAKDRARQTGLRGETYAYWYLRRHGYIFIARNFTVPGVKGEIDLIGYDGPVLAFVEVKTRAGESADFGKPEDAVTKEKRRLLDRMASQFLLERHLKNTPCRFDVLAIESRSGKPPVVRLYKAAF